MWLLPVLGCGGMNSSFSETVSFPPCDVRVCGISTTTPKCLPTITGTRYRTIDSDDDVRPVRQQEPFCAIHTSRGVYTLTTVQYQVPGITGTWYRPPVASPYRYDIRNGYRNSIHRVRTCCGEFARSLTSLWYLVARYT